MSTEIMEQQQTFSLAPRTLTEAMEFAQMMAQSELVPRHFRGKPGDVLIAVQMGAEVGLAPMAAIQNIAVINGKPGMYGDGGKAVLLAKGCIIEEDDIADVEKNGFARCKITRKGRPPVERTYSVENARTAGLWGKDGPWRTNPYRQMAWRAFWFAARDAAADLLKGIGGAEELGDYTVKDMGTINQQTGEVTKPEPKTLPAYTAEQMDANVDTWRKAIESGKTTPERIAAMIGSKYTLSAEQIKVIESLNAAPAGDVIDADFTAAYEGAEQ